VVAFAACTRAVGGITIRDLAEADLEWAASVLDAELAGRWQARRGELVDVLALPGLVVVIDGRPAGLLAYRLEDGSCEIEALVATAPGAGIGTALIDELRRRTGHVPIRVVTTNDNVRAMAFYEHRGFRLVAVRRGAVDEARRTLKPTIGLLGQGGIPIRDELEFLDDARTP
jgi:ribosomal protein S18 acetylase RimI-like enzyme